MEAMQIHSYKAKSISVVEKFGDNHNKKERSKHCTIQYSRKSRLCWNAVDWKYCENNSTWWSTVTKTTEIGSDIDTHIGFV